jgi:hypothetical protein
MVNVSRLQWVVGESSLVSLPFLFCSSSDVQKTFCMRELLKETGEHVYACDFGGVYEIRCKMEKAEWNRTKSVNVYDFALTKARRSSAGKS